MNDRTDLFSPYDASQRHWDDRERRLGAILRRHNWMMAGQMLITCIAVGGSFFVWGDARAKYVPYVIEVDKLGQLQAVRVADRASPTDERILRSLITGFVHDLRLVTADGGLQKKAVTHVYALMKKEDPAAIKVSDWYRATEQSNPFVRAKTETIAVEIITAMPQNQAEPANNGQQSWIVDWRETTYARDGSVKVPPTTWSAIVTVYQTPPEATYTEEQILANPVGLWVRDVSWQKKG
jgi:type IV secretion system protein VirB5